MTHLRLGAAGLALLALAGCSLFDDPAEVNFAVWLSPEAASLDVEAALDGRAVALEPLATTGSGPVASSGPVETRARRTTLSCSVSNGTASARATVTLDLEAGFRYPVRCAVDTEDPAGRCFGCAGSERAALDPALGLDDDLSLYLVWSAEDPDNPVLY